MKQVHWTLPFGNIDGTKDYRIDIYAEGAPVGGIRQLTGGSTPFVTDEDNNDDFFAPVRGQTGCINVIDNGGTLMSEIMPSDSIDRPVRLIRVSDGMVMWQGFLSCETYTQNYTDRPNEFTINVNSVLEAMDSVELDVKYSGFKKVRYALVDIFDKIYNTSGIEIGAFHYPAYSWSILNKYIDMTVLYDLKSQDNEDSTVYTTVGISVKKALERICAYMGWCARENGTGIYLCEIGGSGQFYADTYAHFRIPGDITPVPYGDPTDMTMVYMRDMEYRGVGHKITSEQGAKSVEVVASIKDYKLDMQLPECPVGNLQEKTTDVGDILASPLDDFDNRIELRGLRARAKHDKTRWATVDDPIMYVKYAEMLPLADAFFHPETPINWEQGNGDVEFDQYYYAFFCKKEGGDFKNALAIYGVPGARIESFRYEGYRQYDLFAPTQGNYLFKIKSIVTFVCHNGWLHLDLMEENVKLIEDRFRQHEQYITMSVKYADKWWNGTDWQNDFSTFKVNLNDDGTPVTNKTEDMDVSVDGGIFMPVNEYMSGTAEVAIYHDVSLLAYNYDYERYWDRWSAFISSLELKYLSVENVRVSGRSENHYYRLLGLNFRDEVSVSVDLASDLNNKTSPSVLMNTTTDPMTTLHYSDGTDERPERVLLARLADYYGQVRRKISLEVDRPTTPLPLVRVTGYDRKTYLPLSESRDWRTGVSTIRCFECPE